MSRPLALDLFCGAGGASMGLHRAGFQVVGVDIRPQPRYPFRFVRADALNPPFDLSRFDLIWASPPCQEYVNAGLRALAAKQRRPDTPRKPMLIELVRAMLAAAGLTVIENVPSAPLRRDLVLDGDMFGLNTYRQRIFELNFFAPQPSPNPRFGPESRQGAVTLAGRGSGERVFYDGGRLRRCRAGNKSSWSAAVGIDWMTRDELRESIPPAYGEFIGRAAPGAARKERGMTTSDDRADIERTIALWRAAGLSPREAWAALGLGWGWAAEWWEVRAQMRRLAAPAPAPELRLAA